MPFSPCDASSSSPSVPNEPSACCAPGKPPLPSTSLTASKTYRKRKRQSSPAGRIIVTKKRRTCSLDSSTADKPVNDMQIVAAAASPPRNIDVSVELVLFDKSWINADSLLTSQEEPDDDQSKDQTSETELKRTSINLAKSRHYSAEDLEEERKYGVSTKLGLRLV